MVVVGRAFAVAAVVWAVSCGGAFAQAGIFGLGLGERHEVIQGKPWRDGAWFVSGNAAIGKLSLPQWRANYIVHQGFQTVFGNPFFEPEFSVHGAGASLGYAWRQKRAVVKDGGRVRVYLTLGAWRGKSDENRVDNI